MIHTSGSTGRPKGVVISHGSLHNLFRSHRETLYLPAVARAGRRHLRVGHAWSFSFDASWQPQLWMYDGHEVHVVSDDVRRDPRLLTATVIGRELDFLEVTPSHLEQLADEGVLTGDRSALLALGFGGEAVNAPLWQRLRALTNADGYNLYGPTECTVDSLVAHVRDAERPVVGRPVHNARAAVLDDRLRPVPPGVPGELYLGGAGPGPGLPRPARADRRPVRRRPARGAGGAALPHRRPGPLDPGRPARIPRPHRRAGQDPRLPDRTRRDRGRARRAPGGRAGRRDRPGGPARRQAPGRVRRAGRGWSPDPAELRAFLATRLPAYMVPAAFVALPALPLTANGKLDRKALPAPTAGADPAGRAPRTPLERLVCRAFAAVLGRSEVPLDDNFFDLGGHSMLLVRLRARIADDTGVDVPIADLFQHPSPVALAGHLGDAQAAAEATAPVLALRAGGAGAPLFLLPPRGGSGWCYAGLRHHVDPAHPLYALQGIEEPAEYLRRIRDVQPEGPYHLAGWSLGGLLAYQVAGLLAAAGERVALLALLDPPAPEPDVARSDPDAVLFFTAAQDTPDAAWHAWEPLLPATATRHDLPASHDRMTDPDPLAIAGPALAAALDLDHDHDKGELR